MPKVSLIRHTVMYKRIFCPRENDCEFFHGLSAFQRHTVNASFIAVATSTIHAVNPVNQVKRRSRASAIENCIVQLCHSHRRCAVFHGLKIDG
jgi:hypothetical protein